MFKRYQVRKHPWQYHLNQEALALHQENCLSVSALYTINLVRLILIVLAKGSVRCPSTIHHEIDPSDKLRCHVAAEEDDGTLCGQYKWQQCDAFSCPTSAMCTVQLLSSG